MVGRFVIQPLSLPSRDREGHPLPQGERGNPYLCEKSPRQACPFVLAPNYRCSTRDRDARTGAFWEQWVAPPRSLGQEPGRRSSEGPPSGAIPVPDVAWLHGPIHGFRARERAGRAGELGNV